MKKKYLIFIVFVIIIILLRLIVQYYGAKRFIYNELSSQFEQGYKDYLEEIEASHNGNIKTYEYPESFIEKVNNPDFLEENMLGRYALLEDSIDEYSRARQYVANKLPDKSHKIDLELEISPRFIIPTWNKVFINLVYKEIIKLDDKIAGYGVSGGIQAGLKRKGLKWEFFYITNNGYYGAATTLDNCKPYPKR